MLCYSSRQFCEQFGNVKLPWVWGSKSERLERDVSPECLNGRVNATFVAGRAGRREESQSVELLFTLFNLREGEILSWKWLQLIRSSLHRPSSSSIFYEQGMIGRKSSGFGGVGERTC